MRSVYAKILLWCFGTLLISLLAFILITRWVVTRNFEKGGTFGGQLALEAEDAEQAYIGGGTQRLSSYLKKLNRFLPGDHYLTDRAGRDLVTGEDRSGLLAQVRKPRRPWHFTAGPVVIAWVSSDNRFHYMAVFQNSIGISSFLPYFLLILVAIALLLWVLAMRLASPLKGLARTVRRFGAGDLSARVKSQRRDEIGDVARAFNEMAERIQTLLTAERRLLQDVSHELRSPLARLSFAAELARTAPDRDAAVQRMNKEIQRLADLVGALLQVTRVEGDPRTRNLEPLALGELLEELVDDCGVEADAHGCRLALEAPVPAELNADRELLRRAIENILRNAIRYAPEKSSVDITLVKNGATASVAVRDYGPGVPTEALSNIFKPFFRVDSSRDTATGGVGLGLAIAQRAISLHHGRVSAENANPGLRVRVELPLHEST